MVCVLYFADLSSVQTAILEALDQRQTEERNVLMDIIQMARNSAAIIREAKQMSAQVQLIDKYM